jgi:hypothetical protein
VLQRSAAQREEAEEAQGGGLRVLSLCCAEGDGDHQTPHAVAPARRCFEFSGPAAQYSSFARDCA